MQISLESQLKQLLSESIAAVIERENTTFDRLSEPFGKSIVLFGSGSLGRKALSALRSVGIEPLAFSDNNPAYWHTLVEGIEVLTPQEATNKFGQNAVFVVTICNPGSRFTQVEEQLLELNCSKVISFASLFWKYSKTLLPQYSWDLPHKISQEIDDVVNVFSLWADEESRREYLALLKLRMLLDFEGLPSPIIQESYFLDGIFTLLPTEVFVDCGAFDGDTLKIFLKRQGNKFTKFFALEPDPVNLEALQEYVSTLDVDIQSKVTVLPLAAGTTRGKVRFNAAGTSAASIVENGNLEIECAPLDEILDDCVPTFIKMDIEGSEVDALVGASQVIEQYVPILAICVYHEQSHLWRIPLFIHSLSSRYRFFLRPYAYDGFEVVCYAIPIERLLHS